LRPPIVGERDHDLLVVDRGLARQFALVEVLDERLGRLGLVLEHRDQLVDADLADHLADERRGLRDHQFAVLGAAALVRLDDRPERGRVDELDQPQIERHVRDAAFDHRVDFLLQGRAVERVELSLEGQDRVVVEQGLVDLHGHRSKRPGRGRRV
jgi:hypothetical protein